MKTVIKKMYKQWEYNEWGTTSKRYREFQRNRAYDSQKLWRKEVDDYEWQR